MPKHHPSSPELQSALNRFFSFSKDLNIIFSHFSQTNPPQSSYSFPSKKKSHRKRPTARSVTWRQQRIAATTPAAAAPSPAPISIPPGRNEVLRHLIRHSDCSCHTSSATSFDESKQDLLIVEGRGGDGQVEVSESDFEESDEKQEESEKEEGETYDDNKHPIDQWREEVDDDPNRENDAYHDMRCREHRQAFGGTHRFQIMHEPDRHDLVLEPDDYQDISDTDDDDHSHLDIPFDPAEYSNSASLHFSEETSPSNSSSDPDYLPSDDTLDGLSSDCSSNSSDAVTSELSSEGDYDSENPYGDNCTADRSLDFNKEQSDRFTDLPHITDRRNNWPLDFPHSSDIDHRHYSSRQFADLHFNHTCSDHTSDRDSRTNFDSDDSQSSCEDHQSKDGRFSQAPPEDSDENDLADVNDAVCSDDESEYD